ncbi:MAG: DNA gyrase subunit A [Bacillariaceae sp.]|jgi:DNA gyrase subunit A
MALMRTTTKVTGDEIIKENNDKKGSSSSNSSDGDDYLALGLSRIQADSVLKLQLGQLTRLNQGKLNEERNDLESQRKGFQRLLDEDDAVYSTMVEEMGELDRKYGHERKSKIIYDDDGDVHEMDMVKNSRSGKLFLLLTS